jgi:hypothetical protein
MDPMTLQEAWEIVEQEAGGDVDDEGQSACGPSSPHYEPNCVRCRAIEIVGKVVAEHLAPRLKADEGELPDDLRVPGATSQS